MQTSLAPRTDKVAFREKVVRGKPVTAQEVFDVAVEGVILQGGPSVSGRSCVYRARNGRECAAGQLIPDNLYGPEWEGCKIRLILNNRPDTTYRSLRKHGKLLETLQELHDDSYGTLNSAGDAAFLKAFKRRTALLARNLGLTVPPLAQLEEPSSAFD